MRHFPTVRIEMPEGEGPSVTGTKIFIDGVERKDIHKAVLMLEAGSAATLEISMFAEVSVNGQMDVKTIHVCPECKHELVKKLSVVGVTTDVTNVGDTWQRNVLVASRDANGDVTEHV